MSLICQLTSEDIKHHFIIIIIIIIIVTKTRTRATGGINVVACDSAERAQLLIDNGSQMTSLKTIILMEAVTEEVRQAAQVAGIKLLHFEEVEVRMALVQSLWRSRQDGLICVVCDFSCYWSAESALVFVAVLVLLVCRECSCYGGCSCVTGLQRVFLLRWLSLCYWPAESVLVSGLFLRYWYVDSVMVLGVVLVLLVCREYSGFGGCSYVTGLQRVFLLRWLFFCYWSADSVLVTVVVLVLLFCSERSGFSGCPCAGGLS